MSMVQAGLTVEDKEEKHRRQACRTTCEPLSTVPLRTEDLQPALGWDPGPQMRGSSNSTHLIPSCHVTDSAPPLYDSRVRQTLSLLLSMSGFCYNRKSS